MIKNHAIENIIRENKIYQIDNVIETSAEEGMIHMDKSLAHLVKQGLISMDGAKAYCKDIKNFEDLLRD
jgi:twitching motility protein PilT